MDIWKHGTYVDLWSVVHFFSGALLGGVFWRMGIDFIYAFLISVLLLLAWEIFEWALDIIEPSVNVVVDVLIGILGFLAAAYVYTILQISFTGSFYPLLAVTFALSLWGFIDFKIKGYR